MTRYILEYVVKEDSMPNSEPTKVEIFDEDGLSEVEAKEKARDKVLNGTPLRMEVRLLKREKIS